MSNHTPTELVELLTLCVLAGFLVGGSFGGVGPVVYVETGSMAPALSPGDGFVVLPSPLVGEPAIGDVVVFTSQRPDAPDLITHRIVGETSDGYLTRGDANPFVDQSGDEPPVTSDRIVGVAVSVGGHLLVIPGLGRMAESAAGVVPLFRGVVLVGILVLAARTLIGENRSRPARSQHRSTPDRGSDPRRVVLLVGGFLVIASMLAMVVPAGAHQVTGIDGVADADYVTTNAGFVPALVVLNPSSNLVVDESVLAVPPRGEATTTVTARDVTAGATELSITEYRYLAVLPTSVLLALHHVHPWLALGAVTALLGGGFTVVGLLAVGTGRTRSRRRATNGNRRSRG